jgi:hypothetical protein
MPADAAQHARRNDAWCIAQFAWSMLVHAHFAMFAGHSRWANRRLCDAAASLSTPTIGPSAAPSSGRRIAR